MTVAVAHTVLRFKPTFGNTEQIKARNLLRLATYYLEVSGETMWHIRLCTGAELERKLEGLGYDPREILATWNAVEHAVGMGT